MTKRIICTILALVFCFSFAISVSAEERNINFVYDELGCLTPEESTALSDFAWEIYQKTGVGVFFSYLATEDIDTLDTRFFVKGITNYVLMVENETHWYIYLGGKCEEIDPDAEEALRAAYDADETYVGGVGAYMDAAMQYFPALPAPTEAVIPEDEEFVYDDAGLLSEAEETALVDKLTEVSHATNTQIVVATIESMDGGDIDGFVEYLYDTMGFGYGETHEGVLLLVCMDPREYRILSNGYAGEAIGPDQIDSLCDVVEFYLAKGNYATAFTLFANECEGYLEYYQAGSPFNVGKNLAISLVIGIIVGLIVVLIMKSKLKSVRKQNSAHVYVKPDSMKLTYSRDIFLYRNVTFTKKQERTESHSSGSGGSTRSVGGGSF
ncbi:MAG: TPM domain-containing protein [Oscillospiraceae bacterium]|nr:TPM domain-containing protein [Oscillospiraceae bacterium]